MGPPLLAVLLLVGCSGAPNLYDFDADGSPDAEDCAPEDPEIRPGGQDPWGDGIDQNCDGADGRDADGDGFASDGEGDLRDCNDSDPAWYPGAVDSVDEAGADSDCDGVDGVDADGDGWASEASGGLDCDDADAAVAQEADVDQDGVSDCDGDCDDLDPAVGPQHDEACDARDTDCDGTIPGDEVDGDEDGSLACADCDDDDPDREVVDLDGDGVTTCAALPDCDDTAAQIHPYQPDQHGDGIDTNCDGADGIDADGDGFASVSSGGTDCADDDAAVTPETDVDGDGSSACADCDDADSNRAPTLIEVCEDGIDNDCDGAVDTDADLDGDGFTACVGDSNDASGAAFPGAFDAWGDALDLNCDGVDGTDADGDGYASDALDDTADCDDADPAVYPQDADGDGYSLCAGDCDDTDPATHPFAWDVACDGLDGNCSSDSAAEEALEQDVDGDGYLPCAPYVGSLPGILGGGDCDDEDAGLNPVDADGDGATLCDGDCDDADANRWPGAVEDACDGFDSDCAFDDAEADLDLDGELPCEGDCDDADPATYGVDLDFDGLSPCGPDGIAGTADDDCDDADITVFPGNLELCDGQDGDCVFSALEVDDDGDGYVECSPWVGSDPSVVGGQDCDDANPLNIPVDADGDGVAGCGGDCDETDAAVYPGAPDPQCDGLDTNCAADPAEVDDDGDGWLDCVGYTGSVAGISGGGDCDDTDPVLNLDNVDGDAWDTCDGDCDDTDNVVFPGNGDAPCDGLDTDCILDPLEVDDDGDGYVECQPWTGADAAIVAGGDCDDGDPTALPIDLDGDGVAACSGDCDDTDPAVFPGQPDLSCDGVDSDCEVDATEVDGDGDGLLPCEGDCDDADPAIYLGAPEQCNGADDDCNGSPGADEIDNDGDGFDECDGGDCDDLADDVFPGATELCDWIDNNCNGVADEQVDLDGDGVLVCGADGVPDTGDEDCDDGDPDLTPLDLDADGYVSCPEYIGPDVLIVGGDDCDDLDAGRWPGNPVWEAWFEPDFDCSGDGSKSLAWADATFLGEGVNDKAGERVAGLGDVDGDGLADFVIGVPANDDPSNGAGKTYVFLGSTVAAGGAWSLGDADATFTGESGGHQAGAAVAGAGDVDGDGLDDLLIGAYKANGGGDNSGKSYLLLGSTISPGGAWGLSLADADFIGEAAHDESGRAVASAGDVDGDGLDDVLIGAMYNDEGGADSGRSYLFFGSTVGGGGTWSLSEADASFVGEAPGDQSGAALAGIGDVDGDGLGDIAIGAPYNDESAADAGKVYIVLGSTASAGGVLSLAGADASFLGEAASDRIGASLAGLDVDGDGSGDLLIGTEWVQKTYLFFGSTIASGGSFNVGLADAEFVGARPTDVSAAGDVDGDSLEDLVIGTSSGVAYLFRGSTVASGGSWDMWSWYDARFVGEDPTDDAGKGVTGVGDVDGDGLDDLLVGAPNNDDNGGEAGKVYLVLSPY